jgi:hypothetical protein
MTPVGVNYIQVQYDELLSYHDPGSARAYRKSFSQGNGATQGRQKPGLIFFEVASIVRRLLGLALTPEARFTIPRCQRIFHGGFDPPQKRDPLRTSF